MNKPLRRVVITSSVFTLLMLPLIWSASYGRVANDSGIIAMIATFPTSYLFVKSFDYEALRATCASFLNFPFNDRFAMVFDALLGWVLGCLQYSLIAIVFPKVLRLWRLSAPAQND